ncbi:MAG: Stp1/IreP family PP2C-type Ser/Thr phosphatase [Acidobacteriota bacterium]
MAEANDVIITTIAGFTDVGLVRSNNEDNFLIVDLTTGRGFLIPQRISHKAEENRLLLAVSDGVGGANSGEVASSMAVHSMRVELLRRTNASVTPFDRLVQAVEKANALIWAEGQSNPERRGMGATITAALIEKNVAYIAEVGDSRGYIIHAGRIKQITTDQSLVSILVSRGLMTAEQAETAPGRNIILQSLGCQQEVKVAVTSLELTAGDYLLLCSDGLSGKVKDEEMLTHVQNNPSPEEACKQLIELAKQRGGDDNITVIITKFEGLGLKPPEYVPRLTTHIEVLAAFDPEGDDSHKKEDKGSRDTKMLGSEKGKAESIYTRTLGGVSASKRSQPTKYTRSQFIDLTSELENRVTAVLEALRKQIDCLKSMMYWAHKADQDIGQLTASVKKLEHLIEAIQSNKLSLEDAKKLTELFSE